MTVDDILDEYAEQLTTFHYSKSRTREILAERLAFVDDNNVIRTEKWQEFHKNGQLWIDGEIALIKEQYKGLYDCRDGWYDNRGCDDLRDGKYLIPKGQPVVRIGIWTKYFDNGQIAWQLDFGDGMYDSKIKRQSFPTYRKDGTAVVY